jgi:multidrug efflux pump subunit AcrA (membrane-fusion protein)
MRDQWYKRVPVKVLSKKNGRVSIELGEQLAGDQIVTQGIGFLRGAELVTEEGVSHGHSH